MKRVTVIVGHPDLLGGSLANRVIVEKLRRYPDVRIRDLKALYPDFVIDVGSEQEALLNTDTLVLQYPFYWYSVPGILKEWMDRVLTHGFAFGSEGTKLRGKDLVLSVTVGGPEESYKEGGFNSYTMDELLKPLRQLSNLTRMNYLQPVISYSMIFIPDVYNVKEEVEERAREHADRLINALGLAV